MKEDFTVAYEIARTAEAALVERRLIEHQAHLLTSERISVIQDAILKGLAAEGYVRITPVQQSGA